MDSSSNNFICIFDKKDDPNVCYLCYTNDIDKKLDEINSGLYRDFYSIFLKYAVGGPDEAAHIFEIIDSINPDLRMENNPNVFKISPTRAQDILLKIYGLEELVSKQVKNVDAATEKTPSNSAFSTNGKNDFDNVETNINSRQSSYGIVKKDAIKLLESVGFAFKNKNITFASKNGLLNYYWANPHKSVLSDDWYLILNDYLDGMLYVFFIAGMTLTTDEIPVRTDSQKPDCLKIAIRYGDKKFTNDPGKGKTYPFKKFLVFFYKYASKASQAGKNWTDLDTVLSQETKDVYTLEDDFNLVYGQPTEFYYDGQRYEVTDYTDMIKKTFQAFSKQYKNEIYGFGDKKYKPTDKCRKPYITRNKSDITYPEEISGFPGLYFNLTLSGEKALGFIKSVAKDLGINPKTYSYKVIIVPQKHK